MEYTTPELVAAACAVLAAGAVAGWLLRGLREGGRLARLQDDWQLKFDETARQRDRFNSENQKLRTSYESQLALVHKHELAASRARTELESAVEKIQSLEKQLFAAGAERDEVERKVSEYQSELATARFQVTDIEAEFKKAGEFYKGELRKAFEKRQALEARYDDARAEQESLNNLLAAAKSETASVNKMLASAQSRIENIDEIEQKIIALEAENAQLRHDKSAIAQEVEALQRGVAEFEELKVQNRELAHCLQSMENSRRQYEKDAQRYRQKAEQSDKRSETLSLKLDDVEKSFAEIARKHDEALKVAEGVNGTTPPPEPGNNGKNGFGSIDLEIDDLTKIVGIGRVFQQTLHDLGIYSYRQIANFGPSDIARVNMELKEFKGRMEQDDWIGQAKELLYEKYGEAH
ncbi:MAG: hypothetical protein QNJ07_00400 [Woeseiaceae bacterium]|nr:hypothetical protein [Woeseiaceae bacterium]